MSWPLRPGGIAAGLAGRSRPPGGIAYHPAIGPGVKVSTGSIVANVGAAGTVTHGELGGSGGFGGLRPGGIASGLRSRR